MVGRDDDVEPHHLVGNDEDRSPAAASPRHLDGAPADRFVVDDVVPLHRSEHERRLGRVALDHPRGGGLAEQITGVEASRRLDEHVVPERGRAHGVGFGHSRHHER